MSTINIQDSIPGKKLKHFNDYNDFLTYSKSLFDLSPQEHEGLYNVLVKLQSIGEDPVSTLQNCKKNMGNQDCVSMLKFMIRVDEMDIEEFKAVA